MNEQNNNFEENEQSFFVIIMHSFFVIPFLIAVFCVLLFTSVHMLTQEQRSVYDYLNDVKVGGLTKRWQAAFELSKILANPDLVPEEERFEAEMISAFEKSEHDDSRVRQYLALAMGRMGKESFYEPLSSNIENETQDNLYAIIYSLGMLRDKRAVEDLVPFLDHSVGRIRSAAVVALGNIGDRSSKNNLKKSLNDPEPNVQWGSAISLAQMNDSSGMGILAQLLNREYLSKFPQVDPQEQNHILLAAIDAARILNEPELNVIVKELSESDQNMKVRAAAMDLTKEIEKN